MALPRTVARETLDHLAPDDPRAMRARRDLRRINRIMGSARLMIRSLRHAGIRHPGANGSPLRLLELGAGDGTVMLRIARTLSRSWRAVELTLLDRQALVDPAVSADFARLGWPAQVMCEDIIEWAGTPAPAGCVRWHVILANLFLHHFDGRQLRALLSAVAARCDLFIACEPRRTVLPLVGSHLIGATGASRVTRQDAVLSVHAGFRDAELSALWPDEPGAWRLREHAAGPFSHLFRAVRRDAASAAAD